MPRIPKKVSYINGVKYWDCFMCKKILRFSEFAKTSSPTSPHAAYCRKCNSERSKRTYVPKKRVPYKNLVPNESPEQILKALQGFDPSWTMDKLNKAMNDPI